MKILEFKQSLAKTNFYWNNYKTFFTVLIKTNLKVLIVWNSL